VAFAGRSNAGKSSAINTLCAQKALARTSKTPGRTQLLNFFELDRERRLVDLPGYGFARVSEATKGRWQELLDTYLTHRHSLRGIVLLADVRHPLKDYDRHMLGWCAGAGLPALVLLTKADKLKRGPALARRAEVRRELADLGAGFSAQLFSSLRPQGVDELREVLNLWLQVPEPLSF